MTSNSKNFGGAMTPAPWLRLFWLKASQIVINRIQQNDRRPRLEDSTEYTYYNSSQLLLGILAQKYLSHGWNLVSIFCFVLCHGLVLC